jgi:hypothetical protein
MESIIVFVERSANGANSIVKKLVFEWKNGKLRQLEGEHSQDPVTFCSDKEYNFGFRVVLPPGVKIIGVTWGNSPSTDPKLMNSILREFQPLRERKKVMLSLEYPAKEGENRHFRSITISRL